MGRGNPSKVRQAEMEDRLWDRQTLRIYCDASFNPKTKFTAVAALFVFDGDTQVYSKFLGIQTGNNVTGEIEAVKFAVEQISIFKRRPALMIEPRSIVVYSDYNQITQYVEDTDNVKIEYLGEDKRENPFYTAAHNAARKAIFLRPKSGRLR